MDAYKRWVRRNKDYVHSLESLMNGFTWPLPEQFSESEIGPEAVTSILGIFTAVDKHIIKSTPKCTPPNSAAAEPFSFPYSLCITLLKDIETLVEVVGQQMYGEEKKWNFIAITEASKVLVRLALSGYRMLLHGGENLNDDKDSDSSDLRNPRNLEGRALSALNRFGENARTNSNPSWLRRLQQQQYLLQQPNAVVEISTISSILSSFWLELKLVIPTCLVHEICLTCLNAGKNENSYVFTQNSRKDKDEQHIHFASQSPM